MTHVHIEDDLREREREKDDWKKTRRRKKAITRRKRGRETKEGLHI